MKNSKLITIFAFTTFFTWAQPSLAGEGSGTITLEFVGYNTMSGYGYNPADERLQVFFYTTNHINQPACNEHRSRWVYKGHEQGAEVIIEAARTGREIVIAGTGACLLGSEIVRFVGYPVDYSLHP